MTLNKSPDRGSFAVEREMKKVEDGTKSIEQAEETIDLFASVHKRRRDAEATEEWQQDNLEYDLRRTNWICDKAKASEAYAQNLYAALCNNEFQKRDVMPILQDKTWSCTWRYAGGIIADMQEKGDYINWYCSGIAGGDEPDTYQAGHDLNRKSYVSEGTVTDEIREDLRRLGWVVISSD